MKDDRSSGPASTGWIEQARKVLDAETEAFDFALRSRLNQARQAALASLAPVRRWRWDLWIGGVVTAGLGALLALHLGLRPALSGSDSDDELLAQGSVELDAELLVASDDQLEMYENLEFYAWLQSQPSGG